MPVTHTSEEIQYFLDQYRQAFNSSLLQRLVLSKYQGDEADLKRISVRPVLIKNQLQLSFLYEYQTNHITKNIGLNESLNILAKSLGSDFKNAHLVSESAEIQLRFSKNFK